MVLELSRWPANVPDSWEIVRFRSRTDNWTLSFDYNPAGRLESFPFKCDDIVRIGGYRFLVLDYVDPLTSKIRVRRPYNREADRFFDNLVEGDMVIMYLEPRGSSRRARRYTD